MRAAIFRNGEIVVDTMPEPVPGAGQVLVRTLACGICGSDLHARKHAHRMVEMAKFFPGRKPMDLSRDVVFGHEFCCEIVDYGPATQRGLKPGSRVCSLPALSTPTGPQGIGYSNDNIGGYAERMLLSEALLLPVPNGLAAEHAALTEPLAVGVHAVAKANVRGDEVPLVIGCGPVGLAVIAALKLKGLHPIVAADYSPARRSLAEKLGADIVVDPALTQPYASWAAHAAMSAEEQAADARHHEGTERSICAGLHARGICLFASADRGRAGGRRVAGDGQRRPRRRRAGVRRSRESGSAHQDHRRAIAIKDTSR